MQTGLHLLVADGACIPRDQVDCVLMAHQMMLEAERLPASIKRAPQRLLLSMLCFRVPLQLSVGHKGFGAELAL